MTLDFLDRAFIDRWDAFLTAAAIAAAQPAGAVPSTEPVRTAPAAAPLAAAPAAEPAESLPNSDFVDRLLRGASSEWPGLAEEIEAARDRGRRSIAIVSCVRGAGCTTLVEAIVRVLRARGRDATGCDRADAALAGTAHDKRIVIVDAGVWFPPGRISRSRLVVASCGCDAAILVRRAGHDFPTGWHVALEAIGVEPLGEVVSFAPPAADAAPAPSISGGAK